MPLFTKSGDTLKLIKEKPFNLERDLQKLTEENLGELFGLEFVSTEFLVSGLYIDTLAFNSETQSFVIIEYKKDRNISVIDQGFSYLSLMLSNKAEFILEYNEKSKRNLKRSDINWSESRVFFTSPQFTTHQQHAINFKDLPLELWQVTRYENGLILYNQIKAEDSSASIKNLGQSKQIQKVVKEVKSYTEADIIGSDKKVQGLYATLKEQISLIDENLTPYPTQNYIGFRLLDNWRVIFNIQKSWRGQAEGRGLALTFTRSQPKDYKDPEKKLEYVSNSMKSYNQHLSKMYIFDEDDVEYASLLLKQAHDRFRREFYNRN